MLRLNHSSLEKVSFFLASFRVVCRSLISFVHRWIVTIFEYVVLRNPLYILTERIIVIISVLGDIGLVIL